MTRKTILGCLAAAVSTLAAFPALAQSGPAEDEAGRWSVAGLLGYGFKDGVNLGLGVRGGYTLPVKVYIGGTFVYHLGKSTSTGFGDITSNIFYFGVEGGYDISAGPVLVRPYLGLGDAVAKVSAPDFCAGAIGCVGGGSNSESRFAVWPGAAVLYPFGGGGFVGGDARFVIVSDFNAFSLFATGGVQF